MFYDVGSDEAATRVPVGAWHAERDRLVGLADRMLGGVVAAEEVAQVADHGGEPAVP
jgi:hypothetical protein